MRTEWVFGYGSLIWNPGFAYTTRVWGLLHGWQRACCRYSFHHRGTHQRPGLVAGLRPGGECKGVAYALPAASQAQAFAYLDAREGEGYLRQKLPIELPKGHSPRFVEAWVYVPNTQHESYFGGLEAREMAKLVAHGVGESGTAFAYMESLLIDLRREGIEEAELEQVFSLAQQMRPLPQP